MWEFATEVSQRPPLVLGIDPRPQLHGPQPLAHIRLYSLQLLEALHRQLGAVKLQAAFFEAMGPAGYALMFELAAAARTLSLPVIFDAKRGDIGSTAQAYAQAFLEAYPGCALTVNPYLGLDTLEPFLQSAQRTGGALFVLVKTSNPGSGWLQDLPLASGLTLSQHLGQQLAQLAQQHRVGHWSRVGAVVGATYPQELPLFRQLLPHSLFLLPGLGAQGGLPERGAGLLNSASRALYYPNGQPNLAQAVAQAQAYLQALRVKA